MYVCLSLCMYLFICCLFLYFVSYVCLYVFRYLFSSSVRSFFLYFFRYLWVICLVRSCLIDVGSFICYWCRSFFRHVLSYVCLFMDFFIYVCVCLFSSLVVLYGFFNYLGFAVYFFMCVLISSCMSLCDSLVI